MKGWNLTNYLISSRFVADVCFTPRKVTKCITYTKDLHGRFLSVAVCSIRHWRRVTDCSLGSEPHFYTKINSYWGKYWCWHIFITFIDTPHYQNICYLINVSWICFLCTITYCSAARSVLQSTCLSKRGGRIRKLSCPAYWQCSQHKEEKNVSHAMWFTFNERAMTQHVSDMWNIVYKFSLVVP